MYASYNMKGNNKNKVRKVKKKEQKTKKVQMLYLNSNDGARLTHKRSNTQEILDL